MGKNQGGAAYPTGCGKHEFGDDECGCSSGMTVRQYYKAMALQALISRPMAQGDQVADELSGSYKKAAHEAAFYADAMIEEDEEK